MTLHDVTALVRGLEKHGGELRLRRAVAAIEVEGGRAAGVRLEDGSRIRAAHVVSNAPVWATAALLPEAQAREARGGGSALDGDTPPTPSFIHLHLGIRGDGLSEQALSSLHAVTCRSLQALSSLHAVTCRYMPFPAGALVDPLHSVAHSVACRYMPFPAGALVDPLHSVAHSVISRYTPLLSIALRCMPLHAVTRRSLQALSSIHHIVVPSWERLMAPQSTVFVSIPSLIDPSLAPPGKHVIHAYLPATEPYELWEGFDRRSDEYKAFKRERAECLFAAIEEFIPDIREVRHGM